MSGAGRRTVEVSARLLGTLRLLAAVGVVAAAAGAVMAPEQMWANWLLVSYYFLTLALGGLVFVALHYASGATWGVAIRRIPEAMAALVPLGVVGVGVVFFARPELYPWMADSLAPTDEPALAFKHAWLSRGFFLVRAAIYAAAWVSFAWAIRRQSRLQDREPGMGRTLANRRLSAAFLVVFGVTFSLASIDWMMSLEPDWYSTIFGVYHFAGLILAALAVIVLVAIWLERSGPLKGILNDDHLHDLGKLLFSFSTFWAYIWFCQYMLIWYANIPEETVYFVLRTSAPWFGLFVLNAALNWVVPSAMLIRSGAKSHRGVMVGAAVVVLLGRWLDLYVMVLPPINESSPAIGVWAIGLLAGGVGFFGIALTRALRGAPLIPIGDPHLDVSLHPEAHEPEDPFLA